MSRAPLDSRGRRGVRGGRSAIADINITPLVDVLLILLVIIMLAMPAFVKRVPVELPVTQFAGAPVPVASLKVYLSEEGKIFVENQAVPRGDLLERIRPGVSVEVGASKGVRYEDLLSLVAEMQARNPREISLLSS